MGWRVGPGALAVGAVVLVAVGAWTCGGDYVPKGTGAATSVGGGGGGAAGGAGGGTVCGDGVREGTEECDDHNTVDGDGCEGDCTNPRCGNGIVDPGELCFLDRYVAYATDRERAQDMVLVDCDEDQDLDVITVDGDSSTVTVLRNDGSGVLGDELHSNSLLETHSADEPVALAAGQLDSGPAIDLAVTGWGTDSITTHHLGRMSGAGDCTFADTEMLAELLYAPQDIAIMDLDGDAFDDVAATTATGGNCRIGYCPMSTASWSDLIVSSQQAAGIAAGNLSGGSLDDIVFVDPTANRIYIGENTGSGFSFQAPVVVGAGPGAVALGDLDDDGDLDAVTANQGDHTISILLGNGALGLTRLTPDVSVRDAAETPVADRPRSVALADLDGDGDLDVVTANLGTAPHASSVTVLLADGTGAMELATAANQAGVEGDFPQEVGPHPGVVRVGDLNGDGALDIVTASPDVQAGTSYVSVLLARP